jgi:hypothetical protein
MSDFWLKIITLGVAGTKEERALASKIKGSYSSLKVVGRGTISIDPSEVHKDLVASGVFERAEKLVEASK